MKTYQSKIEDIVNRILESCNVIRAPVPIKEIAKFRGLSIKPYDLGENVSGVLVIERGSGIIGINPTELPARQRFTIAHELGHYELHREKGDLFVDRQRILFRDGKSSSGELKKEREANAFAAAILMPKVLLAREIHKNHLNVSDEEVIRNLAKKFGVSEIAMTFRIMNLNML